MRSWTTRVLHPLVSLTTLAVLAAPATPANAGVNVWTPIGPDGGEITVLEAHPTLDNIVYAGTRSGVFKSTDHGTTWRLASRGLQNRRISAIAVAPSRGSVVYAGTWDAGVFASNDGGVSWRLVSNLFGRAVLALDVDPRDVRKVWAGTSTGVFRSGDGGATWNASSSSDLIARALDIAVDPGDPDTVYVAGEALEGFGVSGVLKTTDGGATWEVLLESSFSEEQIQIALDPTTPGLLYVSTRAFASPPFDPEETWRSADGGATWEITEGNYPLAVDRLGVVYAGDRHSDDHGQTWATIAGISAPQQRTLSYATSAGGPGRIVTLWAGTQDDGVFRSRDGGASWQQSSRGLHATAVSSLVIDPRQPRVMYAGTVSFFGVRAFKTQSSGARWRPLGLVTDDISFFTNPVLALDPRDPRTVYAAWSRHFARSDDGGATWSYLLQGEADSSAFSPRQIVVDPADSDVVYVTGDSLVSQSSVCNLARSEDRGATFQCLPPFDGHDQIPLGFAIRLFADPGRPGRLWVPVLPDLFWRSDDRGTTWTAVRPRGLERAGFPISLTFDPARPHRLYLTTRLAQQGDGPTRVWRSDDGGRTWIAWGTNGIPANSTVTDLLIDPRQPSVFHAVVNHFFDPSRPEQNQSGVYWSRNGGRTWFPLVNGLPRNVVSLVMDPRNPRQLYATTSSLGIYAFTRQ